MKLKGQNDYILGLKSEVRYITIYKPKERYTCKKMLRHNVSINAIVISIVYELKVVKQQKYIWLFPPNPILGIYKG